MSATISAVADELVRVRVLQDTEVEIIADAATGDVDASLAQYRANFGPELETSRADFIARHQAG